MNNFYNGNTPWELLTTQLAGKATAQEQQQLQQWLDENPEHQSFWKELQSLWSQTQTYGKTTQEAQQLDHVTAWSTIQQRISGQPTLQVVHKKNGWHRYGRGIVAAAVMLVITTLAIYMILPTFTQPNSIAEVTWRTIENELEAPKTVQMPDGSTIVLNQGSQLSYPEKFDERKVKLVGEAFFEVAKNAERPFSVRFGEEAMVEVLGTSFNVQAFEGGDEYRIAVQTGRVKFQADPTKIIELSAGEAASFHQPTAELQQVEDPNALFWKTGRLEYENQPLAVILADLERHYGAVVRVEQESLLNCLYKGSFEQDKLETIFQKLQFAMDLTIEEQDDTFMLSGEGCPAN